ncbi:MAG: alcohol dehydrogenase catalytic domain-containing protein [Myxococcota bacterium]
MKRVELHGPNDVRLIDVAEPEPGPRDALIRVAACGICGSDVKFVRQGGLAGPTPAPMALGHELSGVVEAVGSEVDLATGTRVVVNPLGAGNMIGNGGSQGGFAPLLLVENAAAGESLLVVPDDLPIDIAALAEPVGVGMDAVDQVEAAPGDKVAVFGAGPIGLTAIASLRDRDVEDIVAIDFSVRRLEIATKLGARATIQPGEQETWKRLRELHGTEPVLGAPMVGTDCYIEASGAKAVLQEIPGQAKSNARVAIVALHYEPVPVSFLLVMMKQLTLRGAMEYPDDYARTLDLLCRRDLSPMITHRFPLERFHEGMEIACDPQQGGKIMIDTA